MKITTRASYTIRALLDLVQHSSEGNPVRLSDISRREGISHAYLEQLFSRLKNLDVVKGRKGPGGGYVLSRDPDEVPIGDIIRAVEGEDNFFLCTDEISDVDECRRYRECITHHLWEGLSRRVHEFLNSITLADLLKDAEALESHREIHNAKNLHGS
ncbi:MAG: Rrf2 family transcriptional regulator [bacterium]